MEVSCCVVHRWHEASMASHPRGGLPGAGRDHIYTSIYNAFIYIHIIYVISRYVMTIGYIYIYIHNYIYFYVFIYVDIIK